MNAEPLCVTSDAFATTGTGAETMAFRQVAMGELRPLAAPPSGIRISGGRMASQFGGIGRPSDAEIRRQREDFRALVASGVNLVDAARQSRCKLERALEETQEIVRAILDSKAA